MRVALFLSTWSLVLFYSCSGSSGVDRESGAEEPAAYLHAIDWLALPDTLVLGNPTGLGVDSEGDLIVFHRAGRVYSEPFPELAISKPTLLKVDPESGALLDAWGADLFIMPHGLSIDRQDNIWVTDVGLHQVFKFDPSGKLLLSLGEARVPGNDAAHFDRPTDVAVAPDGSFYVSDGYGNTRVMKFSPEGEFQFQWGSPGNEPGQFNLPHGIDLDLEGRVYVADRANNRVQVFTPEGDFLWEWKNEHAAEVYAVAVDRKSNRLFAIDYLIVNDSLIKGSDILELSPDGESGPRLGRSGHYSGSVARYHDVALDAEGNLYTGDILQNRIQKFKPNPKPAD